MDTAGTVFTEAGRRYDRPGKVVTLGPFYPQAQAGAARGLLREAKASYDARNADQAQVQSDMDWTRTINALGKDRRWAHRLLFERLHPLLADGVALAVVPAHTAYTVDDPLRELARRLAAEGGRVDATGCLERHTPIRRILFGGPSTRALHRQTIHVLHPELIQGRPVLLLDDIAKSGASLVTCRELLSEAGASTVQALALGRVTVSREEEG
jgi:phosphoribosylpyrophosphate synthetase